VARRVSVVAALAASIALFVVGVVALSGRGTTRPPASNADVYTQLAQQLKGHLRSLVPRKASQKYAPPIQVPPTGYSCEVASGTGCALHPCIKYAQSVVSVTAATAVTPGRCNGTARASPRTVPIVAP
jgi:hypothetical protein